MRGPAAIQRECAATGEGERATAPVPAAHKRAHRHCDRQRRLVSGPVHAMARRARTQPQWPSGVGGAGGADVRYRPPLQKRRRNDTVERYSAGPPSRCHATAARMKNASRGCWRRLAAGLVAVRSAENGAPGSIVPLEWPVPSQQLTSARFTQDRGL